MCPTTWHVDLQAYWQFEDTTNDTVGWNDTVGNPNHGELKSGAGYTSELEGRHGKALDLTGNGAYMEVPNDDSFYETLDPHANFTFAAWVKAFNTSGTWEGIVSKGSAYEVNVGYDQARVGIETTDGAANAAGGSMPDNKWVHVVATYDASLSSDNLKLFINGSQVASTTHTGNMSNNSDPLILGEDSGVYLDGRLDQVRLYHRALNTSEIEGFVDHRCGNRQRSQECYRNPELCDTPYSGGSSNYHCNYGNLDNPNNTQWNATFGSPPSGSGGTGICCPKDQDAYWDGSKFRCGESDTCGPTRINPPCEYNITNNESAWFGSRSDGENNACNSQVNRSHEDLSETSRPEGSQACCYIPKDGVEDYWYKDGNIRIYG